MINGVHAIIYSRQAEAVRAFFRETLGLSFVDAGHGWQIFALSPAEVAAHPVDDAPDEGHELYLMCDDLDATLRALEMRGVETTVPIREERWGRVTRIRIAEGTEIGLYQPKHPTAIHNKDNEYFL